MRCHKRLTQQEPLLMIKLLENLAEDERSTRHCEKRSIKVQHVSNLHFEHFKCDKHIKFSLSWFKQKPCWLIRSYMPPYWTNM